LLPRAAPRSYFVRRNVCPFGKTSYIRFQKSIAEMQRHVDDFLTYLTGDRGYSAETVVTYRESLRKVAEYVSELDSEMDWGSVDSDVIRSWMAAEMRGGRTARTVAKDLSALRSFYKYLLRTGRVETDPARAVRSPKAHAPLPVFLKTSEMDRLFDDVKFPEGYEGLRDRTILLTFYTTGLRVSEMAGLDIGRVDLDRGELKVTGKRNKQRIVPFGEELRGELSRYLTERRAVESQDAAALFLNSRGRRMTAPHIRTMVKAYLSLVTTQKKRSPHVLRHTFATAMLNNGADLEAIKELLGHESIDTTEVYTHTTFAELKKEYQQAHPRA
jgi:integrase/recombinase XerC